VLCLRLIKRISGAARLVCLGWLRVVITVALGKAARGKRAGCAEPGRGNNETDGNDHDERLDGKLSQMRERARHGRVFVSRVRRDDGFPVILRVGKQLVRAGYCGN